MIRKLLIIGSGFLLLVTSVFSQNYHSYESRRHEPEKLNTVSLDYGFLSTVNLSLYIGSWAIDYFIDTYGNTINHTGYQVTGPLGISYTRNITNFELGVSIWYSSHGIIFSGYPYGTPTIRTYGLLIDANYIYFNRNNFRLYSGLSFGPGYFKVSNIVDDKILQKFEKYLSSLYLAGQVNVFGVRYGKDFGITVETGFGHKGLVHFGVDYMF